MSNDDVYASGLLNRALDPESQPESIQKFLKAEIDLLRDMIAPGMRVLDVGCGTGRHLLLLGERLAMGVGVDYERSYVADAERRVGRLPLFFVVGDATSIPSDLAHSLSNVRSVIIGPHASDAAWGARGVVIDTGIDGIHASGTALRTDDVPLPLRATLTATRSTSETIRAVTSNVRRTLLNAHATEPGALGS